MNEPWCSAMLGYAYGRARARPTGLRGRHRGRTPPAARARSGHRSGCARHATAAGRRPFEFGITLNLGNAIPASDSAADREAARRADGLGARLYLDPLLRGSVPGRRGRRPGRAGRGDPGARRRSGDRSARRSTCWASTTTPTRSSPASTRHGREHDDDGHADRAADPAWPAARPRWTGRSGPTA